MRVTLSAAAPVIGITGSASTPESAAEYANAAAGAFIAYGDAHRGETGVRVASMSSADAPDRPTTPNLPLSLAVGASSGVLLAGLATGARPARKAVGT
ncbi:hypothetical protein [Thermomonospora umbrina]|uniref:Uncharacterized protein n=1 Tax=Thermomonospora umbrina TaxID=111806 RepID=A0A3D9T1L2_9ACTN|nr:hypothetical protein [Thermomonospora umbrina]REE97711.1 hypothetical protein DFJ69_3185 [Thermomonospora umbrina]